MPFITLFSAPCLSVNYDSHRNCLALDVRGQLGALALQDVTLKIAQVPLGYSTWCLVQDNLALTKDNSEVEIWLLDQLLPAFYQVGVKHWTWVCRPTLRSQFLAEQVAQRLPQVTMTVFNDAEHASSWLRSKLLHGK